MKTFGSCDLLFVMKSKMYLQKKRGSLFHLCGCCNEISNTKKHQFMRTSVNINVCLKRMIQSKFDTVKNSAYVMKIKLRYCD